MPSPTEHTTKRRRRAAAALGIALAVVGGLAYATTRDGEPPIAAAPLPPLTPDTTAAPDAVTTTTTTATVPDGPAAAPAHPSPGLAVGSKADIGVIVARRNGTPPLTPVVTRDFTVSGSPPADYLPGVSQPVDLTISNPNGSDLTVTAVSISVGPASVPACGAGNLVVTRDFSGTVVVPAHTTRSLSGLDVPQGQWPVLTMPDTSSPQDACQHATFPLTYTGTGSMPS